MCNPCVFLFTHTSSLSVDQLEPVGDNQSVESGEYAQLLGTNGRWHAGLGKEVMVELSGYGSANDRLTVFHYVLLYFSLSPPRSKRFSLIATTETYTHQ
ncbi:hypothetical protein NQZ68_004576 [Dissostichus eleginoides]|nr:hypothetical protein NQZ68_004576 [Dissostichus eleginoides]